MGSLKTDAHVSIWRFLLEKLNHIDLYLIRYPPCLNSFCNLRAGSLHVLSFFEGRTPLLVFVSLEAKKRRMRPLCDAWPHEPHGPRGAARRGGVPGDCGAGEAADGAGGWDALALELALEAWFCWFWEVMSGDLNEFHERPTF